MADRSDIPYLRRADRRRGKIVVLAALLMAPMAGMLAFAIDLGVIYVTKAELQRTADCAALAAAWELMEAMGPASSLTASQAQAEARAAANEYASINSVLSETIAINPADIEIGYQANPLLADSPFDTTAPELFNVARVRVRKDANNNGAIPTLFGSILGTASVDRTATATAAFLSNINGFEAPLNPNENVPMLPFAFDLPSWDAAVAGTGPDNWAWDEERGEFVPGSDGIPEFNMYPIDTGSPGNRGTVNIGGTNNSTSRLSRQILEGVSADDLAFHGGSLQLNDQLELNLDGNPGISAGFQDELGAIVNESRIVPIFSEMTGSGANSTYTIVEWGGVRICEVDLTGNNKRVIAQAGEVSSPGGIPATSSTVTSRYIYSTVWLSN